MTLKRVTITRRTKVPTTSWSMLVAGWIRYSLLGFFPPSHSARQTTERGSDLLPYLLASQNIPDTFTARLYESSSCILMCFQSFECFSCISLSSGERGCVHNCPKHIHGLEGQIHTQRVRGGKYYQVTAHLYQPHGMFKVRSFRGGMLVSASQPQTSK